jgi:DNA-binding transcriptional ArsR family regulator
MDSLEGAVSDDGDQITDDWWASLAKRLLHPVQVQIIEALRQSDDSFSAHDLAETVEGQTATAISYHLRRLRTLGAIAYAEAPQGKNPLDMRFRLVVGTLGDGR